ncbi:MAG: SCP2 sterol-binding domain-containing protein, partial [Solirubrobacterales bacterium]
RLLERVGEAALARLVRGRTDDQLHRLFDRGPGLGAIFRGMEAALVPERADGIAAEIQYELRGRDGVRRWVVSIRDRRAEARRGAVADPAVTMRASVPDFVRLVSREAFAPKLLLEGRVEVEGDFMLAGRLDEIFGGQRST